MDQKPVARGCPRCGSAAFARVKVERGIAFTDDRRYKQCGTRYTPPTPAWAAVLFIAAGGFFLVFAGCQVLALLSLVRVSEPLAPLFLSVFSAFLALPPGVLCLRFGLRNLKSQPAERGSMPRRETGAEPAAQAAPPDDRVTGRAPIKE